MRFSFQFNRPISPHILAYEPVQVLLFSILHRISGLILTFFITTTILTLKLCVNPYYFIFTLGIKSFFSSNFLQLLLTFMVSFYFILHFIFGVFSLRFNNFNSDAIFQIKKTPTKKF